MTFLMSMVALVVGLGHDGHPPSAFPAGWRVCVPASLRELLATGETARKRTVEASDELTAQEALIAPGCPPRT
jgi:hypothetical protein